MISYTRSSKSLSSPISSTASLSKYEGTLLEDPTLFRSIVGALKYCTITRPEIAFVVKKICQFLTTPSDVHWLAVKRVLRYLKGTLTHGLAL